MDILVKNVKTISQESSFLNYLVSVVKMSYLISIDALKQHLEPNTIHNLLLFLGRTVSTGLYVENLGPGKCSCNSSSVWDKSDIFANLVFQMRFQIIFSPLKLSSFKFSSHYQDQVENFYVFTTVSAALKHLQAMVISMTTISYFHENEG